MVATTIQETNFVANFKQLCLEQAVARTHNIKINANFKMKGFVRLSNSGAFYKQCRLIEVCASNPFILKLHLSLSALSATLKRQC